MDPHFATPDFDKAQVNATMYYVPCRARSARKWSGMGYASKLRDELGQWQAEFTAKGYDPETTSVAVVLADGTVFATVGPMNYPHKAALHRAGVNARK